MNKNSGKSNLNKKCFQIALGSFLLLNKVNAQNSEYLRDTTSLWGPKEILKFKTFKFSIQDNYKLISETNDTIVLEKYFEGLNDTINIPVKIIVNKKGEDNGVLTLLLNGKSHKLKLISDFVIVENNIFTLTLNPGGQIHKTFKIDHKSHMSHSSHYSHYSSNPKQ
jgi:hypothetical protein